MKHAFLIMAHEQPQLLAHLLLALQHERAELFVHIDRGAPFVWEDVAAETQTLHKQRLKSRDEQQAVSTKLEFSRIHVLQPTQEVHWGDVSQVEIELRLLSFAREQGEYVHYHWLSGVDFLLHPVEKVLQFFDAHAENEFLGFWNTPEHERNVEKRTRYYYPFTAYLKKSRHLLAHRLTTPLRKLVLIAQKLVLYRRFGREHFYKGYNWASITQGFADYLLTHHAEILCKYRGVLAPDEIYKHTELMHSPFAADLFDATSEERGSQRHIDWERGHPYVFQKEDVSQLLQQSAAFVRKVSLECAQELSKHLL